MRHARLPAAWHGESLGVAREHHARALPPRVFTKAIVGGEDGRLESNRFWGRYRDIPGIIVSVIQRKSITEPLTIDLNKNTVTETFCQN